MTLTQLRAFLAAVDGGSFTAAARDLGTTQPTVSELVRKLEEEHGLALFVRAGRRLSLTAAGAELLPLARRSVDGADRGADVLSALRGMEGGVASLGVLRNAPFYFLPDLVERFHRARPAMRVRLVGQNSVEVAEAVRNGALEAGLVVLPVVDDGLTVRPIMRDEVVWVSADPRRTAFPVRLEQVAGVALVLYDAHYGWNDPTRRQLADRAHALGLTLEPTIEVENVESALALAARGVGDTIASRAVVAHDTFPEGLHAASFAEPFFDTIALITRSDVTLSPGTAELVEMAVRALVGHGGESLIHREELWPASGDKIL
jgi:DNA-binding transcriptional LysR family regulator